MKTTLCLVFFAVVAIIVEGGYLHGHGGGHIATSSIYTHRTVQTGPVGHGGGSYHINSYPSGGNSGGSGGNRGGGSGSGSGGSYGGYSGGFNSGNLGGHGHGFHG